MRSLLSRLLASAGIGASIYGKGIAAGNYKLLRQCYELAVTGEIAASCDDMPETTDFYLDLMLVGFIVVVALSGCLGWLPSARKKFIKINRN